MHPLHLSGHLNLRKYFVLLVTSTRRIILWTRPCQTGRSKCVFTNTLLLLEHINILNIPKAYINSAVHKLLQLCKTYNNIILSAASHNIYTLICGKVFRTTLVWTNFVFRTFYEVIMLIEVFKVQSNNNSIIYYLNLHAVPLPIPHFQSSVEICIWKKKL